MRWTCVAALQGLAVPQIGAQRRDGRGRPEAAAQQPDAMQFLQPLAVHDVGLAPGDILHVPRVDEHDVEPPRLQDLVQGDPVDARGFHRDGGHAARGQPVGQAMKIGREGRERAHGRRVPVRGDGDIVRVGAAVDARGIQVDALEQ